MADAHKRCEGEIDGGYLPKVVPHEMRGLVGHTCFSPSAAPIPSTLTGDDGAVPVRVLLPNAWARVEAALAEWSA